MYIQYAINKGKRSQLSLWMKEQKFKLQWSLSQDSGKRPEKKWRYILPTNLVQGQEPKVRESFGQHQDGVETFDGNWKVTEHWHSGYSLYECSETTIKLDLNHEVKTWAGFFSSRFWASGI